MKKPGIFLTWFDWVVPIGFGLLMWALSAAVLFVLSLVGCAAMPQTPAEMREEALRSYRQSMRSN